MPRSRSLLPFAPCLPLMLTACVGYDAQPIELIDIARQVRTFELPNPLAFADAVLFALQHNPQLQSLAAQARAAGADIAATEIQGQWSSDVSRMALMVDPVALLRLGQRGAAIDVTRAREAEALAALANARWRLIGRIAEVFAAHSELAGLQAPRFAADVDAFANAGLASANAVAQAKAALAGAAAEQHALAAERTALQAELRQLLGIARPDPVVLIPPDTSFPDAAPASEATLLQRPDLAITHARYRIAEAEFARACADQYPSLQIGPDLPLGASGIEGMAWFRIPLDAAGPAHAARERRIAARANLVEAFVAANAEVTTAQLAANAAQFRRAATAHAAAASAHAAASAEAALAVEADVFERFAERATMAVRDAAEHRIAAVAAARARIRLATSAGWPVTAVQP